MKLRVGKLLFKQTQSIPSHLEFPGSCSQLRGCGWEQRGLRRPAGASFTADLSPPGPGIHQAYPPTYAASSPLLAASKASSVFHVYTPNVPKSKQKPEFPFAPGDFICWIIFRKK